MKNDKKLIGTTIVTAIAASLCCITPVLALIAGTTGMASTFSWLDPFRPYLIFITIFVLGFAWYQKLKPITIGDKKEEMDCVCEEDEKPKLIQSKTFLSIVTVFAIAMLAFPYYADVFYPSNNKKDVVVVNAANIETVDFNIKGMTCTGCEIHIEIEVNTLDGIISVKADYEKATAVIKYDKTKVNEVAIEKAILKAGYKIKR